MRASPGRQSYPWRVEDLLRWYSFLGASLVGLAVAWWGISGTVDLARSITWLDMAVLSLVVGGLANTLWLLQGRRALATRRRAELPDAAELWRLLGRVPVESLRVSVAGGALHHRPGCRAVKGKPVQEASTADQEGAGRMPCGLCA